MKILHVVENFGSAGLESLVKDMVLLRDSNKIKMASVCTLNQYGWCGEILQKAGCQVYSLAWKARRKNSFQLSREIIKIVRDDEIDIVHTHNFVPLFMAFPVKFFTKAKLLVTFHGFLEWRTYSKIFYPFLYYLTDRIVIVSEAMRDYYRHPVAFSDSKIIHIVNGIDLRRFDNAENILNRNDIGLSEKDFVVVTVGRLSPVKNQIMLIDVCRMLKDRIPNLKFLFITGHSPDSEGLTEKFIELSEKYGIEENINLLGFRKDIPALLKLADLFVMSSLTEGTSLALIEAMASGLPVVVSNVGGNPWIIKNNENGLLFDVKDVFQLSRHIFTLYQKSEKRKQLGVSAKENSYKYSLENMVRTYETLYQKISAS